MSLTPTENSSEDAKPLLVRFTPPAYLQRRALVLATLKDLSPKCSSLLDIGTGDGGLLSYLVRCDDDVPIERMVGIDPDPDEIGKAALNTRPTAEHREDGADDTRWRALEISLLQGGVADLETEKEKFDCITAIEVLEHLDPPDVEALPRVCLGLLQPRCFIVTTPNREFNQVFDRLEPDGRLSFRRMGIDYAMRHDDHRFEMSRKEFEDWAFKQCETYGYTVRFEGVGTVDNAFGGQEHWRQTFPEPSLDKSFGCSTQAAVFIRSGALTEIGLAKPEKRTKPLPIHPDSKHLPQHLITYEYPWSTSDGFPPTEESIKHIVLDAEAHFRPNFDREKVWDDPEIEVITIDCREFFETCYTAQRVSRFNYDTFFAQARLMDGHLLTPDDDKHRLVQQSRLFDHSPGRDGEPTASLLSAQFAFLKENQLSVQYTFDISTFSKAVVEHCDSIYDIAGEWETSETDGARELIGDWYVSDLDVEKESDGW